MSGSDEAETGVSGSSSFVSSSSDTTTSSDSVGVAATDNGLEKPIGTNLYKTVKDKASFKDTILISFTFINCCVGSGLLAIGKIFAITGWVVALIYMVASVAYCFFCFTVMTRSAYHGNFVNIREMGEKMWGKGYGILVDVSLVLCNLGFLCSYVSVSSDYIRDGIRYFSKNQELGSDLWVKVFKVIIGYIIIFPLSLLRTIDMISLISSFAIIFALVALIGVTVRFAQFLKKDHTLNDVQAVQKPVFPEKSDWTDTVAYFTTYFALFTLHANMTSVQRELVGTPVQRKKVINRATLISMIIVIIIYTLIGIEGSMMFPRHCTEEEKANGCVEFQGNILMMFSNDTAMMIIKFLYAIVVLVSFPCMLYPVRTSISLWFKVDKFSGKKTYPNMTRDERKTLPTNIRNGYAWFVLIGFVILTICIVLAVAIPAIDKVLSLASNIFGVILYEMHEMFVWFKLPMLEKYSVGDLIQTKLIRGKAGSGASSEKDNDNDTETSEGSESSSTNDSVKDKNNMNKEHGKHKNTLASVRKASIGGVEEPRKYSLVFDKADARKSEDMEYLKQMEAQYGNREWSEESTEVDQEVLPGLKKTSSESKHSSDAAETSTKSSTDSSDSTGTRDNGKSSTTSTSSSTLSAEENARRTSMIQRRASAIVEGEGDVELTFPDIHEIKYNKKSARFVVFIAANVFFVAFNLLATVCDIYDWFK